MCGCVGLYTSILTAIVARTDLRLISVLQTVGRSQNNTAPAYMWLPLELLKNHNDWKYLLVTALLGKLVISIYTMNTLAEETLDPYDAIASSASIYLVNYGIGWLCVFKQLSSLNNCKNTISCIWVKY